MFMIRSTTDDTVYAIAKTIPDAWDMILFEFDLPDADFDEFEWFEVERINVRRKLEFVIE